MVIRELKELKIIELVKNEKGKKLYENISYTSQG